MITLYCVRCAEGFRCHGEIPARCPCCLQVTRWVLSPDGDTPTVPWVLTFNDRHLLAQLHIGADEDGDPVSA